MIPTQASEQSYYSCCSLLPPTEHSCYCIRGRSPCRCQRPAVSVTGGHKALSPPVPAMLRWRNRAVEGPAMTSYGWSIPGLQLVLGLLISDVWMWPSIGGWSSWDSHPRAGRVTVSWPPSVPRLEPIHRPGAPRIKGRLVPFEGGPALLPTVYIVNLSPNAPQRDLLPLARVTVHIGRRPSGDYWTLALS